MSYAKLAGLVVSFRFGTVAGGGGGRGGRKKLSAVPGLEGGLLVMFGCFSDLLFLRKNGILADLNFFWKCVVGGFLRNLVLLRN